MTPQIKIFCVRHPQRNLPGISSRRSGETHFSRAFQRAFLSLAETRGIGGHEFIMPGYGIADFVWAQDRTRNGKGNAIHSRQLPDTITAFEMKLSDWRRALRQAYRYTYFSDRTIIVLPKKAGDAAKPALPLFKDLGIGLWIFHKDMDKISKIFTPRPRRPKNPSAHLRALEVLRRKFDLRGPRK